jgi:hypothetical protein
MKPETFVEACQVAGNPAPVCRFDWPFDASLADLVKKKVGVFTKAESKSCVRKGGTYVSST